MPALRDVGLVGVGVALAGGVAYAVWSLVYGKQGPEPRRFWSLVYGKQGPEPRRLKPPLNDEKRDVSVEERTGSEWSETSARAPTRSEPQVRGSQVLVLGLEGAGKTSLLHCFTTGNLEQDVTPTQGFNAVSINREGLQVEFLEIGGAEKLRDYWQMYLKKARVLVFVVDAADSARFPLARTHLHRLLAADPYLPLVLLANKQDLSGACGVADIYEALALGSVGDGRKLYVLVTRVQKGESKSDTSVQDAHELILELMKNNHS